MSNPKLALTLPKRLLLLACVFIVCFLVLSLLSGVIIYLFGTTTPSIRIATVLQDVILFVIPAVLTAVLVTRLPATLLAIDRRPPFMPTLLCIATLILSIPAMDLIITLNQAIPLPKEIADALMQMEQSAQDTVDLLCGPHTIPNLIMSILIVGILAGLSEELLFRGAFQRLLVTGNINHHKAIWASAFVFSVLHMQFYGLVPRMLLGAFFGYALYWTRSLWVPVILHILNNTMFLITSWFDSSKQDVITDVSFTDFWSILFIVLSFISTCVVLRFTYKSRVTDLDKLHEVEQYQRGWGHE